MSTEYIKATLDDFNLIVSTWGSNINNFHYLTSRVLDSDVYAKEYLVKTLANSAGVAYHIKNKGSSVGFIKAVVDGHGALVSYVVNEPYWGQGHASAAVSFITELSEKSSGCKEFGLRAQRIICHLSEYLRSVVMLENAPGKIGLYIRCKVKRLMITIHSYALASFNKRL